MLPDRLEKRRPVEPCPARGLDLLSGTLQYPVKPFQMCFYHPLRSTLLTNSAAEIEHSANPYHHPAFKERFQHGHEDLLLRSPESNPNYIRGIGIDFGSNRRIVKIFHTTERKGHEPHPRELAVNSAEIVPQGIEHLIRGAEEEMAVAAGFRKLVENLASTVLRK